MTASDVAVKAGRREWLGLAVLALATLAVAFDLFVLLLALPHLSRDLGAGGIQQLWITDIYGFMVGGLLITMGTLGDRIGRRRLLLLGAAGFAVASVLAAYSTNPGMLIAARALLGIAGATLGPSTLSLISNMFRDPKQMGSAIGVWAGAFSVGAIVGPIVGGVMLEHFWWGSVFLLGVPAMLLLVVLGRVLLPEFKNPQAGRLDLGSVLLSLGAILPFIYGLKELARTGWHAVPVVALVLGVALAVAFVRRQRTLADPMLDLSLFRNRNFSTSLVSLLCFSLLGGAGLLFITQYFQSVAGLSSLKAGLALLPGMAGSIVSITAAPILARRIRPAFLIAGGLLLAVAGLIVYTQVGAGSGAAGLIVGFAMVSIGGAPLLALGINLVMMSAPPEKAGAAASLPQISNELGSALGIATVGTLGTVVYRWQVGDHLGGLPADAAHTAHESVAGANAVAGTLPRDLAAALVDHAHQAFTAGLHTVAIVSACAFALVAVAVGTLLRQVPTLGAGPGGPGGEAAPDLTGDTTGEPAGEAGEPVAAG